MLVIFGGLPGTGKTSIARELARRSGAVHLRIDSIEQAIRTSGVIAGPMNDAGYRVGYAVAEDNVRLGRVVLADSVNPLSITREAWRDVALRTGVKAVEIEVVCSGHAEHRRRVEARRADIPGFRLPTWEDVSAREYHPWNRPHVVIDTSGRSLGACVAEAEAALSAT